MTNRLRDRIAREIRSRGSLSFAEYMELALYDPEDGFYARNPGPRAHFATSPIVSPVFGMLIANQLRDAWDALGRQDRFTVVEAGAGDGTLAAQIIETAASDPAFSAALRYVAVERSPAARTALAELGLEVREALPERFIGCLIANELLDNLPFRLLRRRDDSVVEVRIALDGDALVEQELPSSLPVPLGERDRPVPAAALGFVRALARSLEAGYAFLFDYGFSGDEPGEPVRGYREHRAAPDLLSDPGSTDITGPVDFGAIAEEASRADLAAWGPVSQRMALEALGHRAVVDRLRARQAELEAAGQHDDAIACLAARAQAEQLVDPTGLGSHRLLVLGTPGVPEPLAMDRQGAGR